MIPPPPKSTLFPYTTLFRSRLVGTFRQRIQASDSPSEPWIAHQKLDRKSTRLNSSHVRISYAVFCLKKKKMHVWTSGPAIRLVKPELTVASRSSLRPDSGRS